MKSKTLFVAWQDSQESRQWFPVGRLEAAVPDAEYRFQYVRGAMRAQKKADFRPLAGFPELERDYHSPKLFAMFRNRVMWPSRPEFPDYLAAMALAADADPMDMLAVGGGRRMTDLYEVFPKLARGDDGGFVCRFFLHGGKHTSPAAQARVGSLRPGEELRAAVELNNPLGELALQLQSADDYQLLGWAPRYLAPDLAQAEAPGALEARVVRVNPPPVPSEQRALVELRGRWPESYEPMSSEDYQPLAG